MLTSNVHPSWPLGRKVALLDDAGEPIVAYAYRGVWGANRGVGGRLDGITSVPSSPSKQSRSEVCPICGEPVVRISRNYNYGGWKTIVVVCACGSVVGYGEREVILYSMSDECMYRIGDII